MNPYHRCGVYGAEQLAAAIARAELAEQARDSAYLAHNLTRQRLDAALAEVDRLRKEPIVPFPGLGETATEFQLMARELAELRAYRDRTEEALRVMSRVKDSSGSSIRLLRDLGLLRLPGLDSSHDQEGGVCLDQGKEKAPGKAR